MGRSRTFLFQIKLYDNTKTISMVLTNEKSTRKIVLCNTKAIAIIKKLIAESSIKKQPL